MSPRNAAGIALLTIAATASWLAVERSDRASSTLPSTRDPAPGYYLREATIFGTDADGRTLYELRAVHIRHVPESDSIELDGLHLDYDIASRAPWRLDAQRGVIPSDGASITLAGKVRLVNTPLDGSVPTVIRTESLEVGFLEHVASSAEPVEIARGGHVLTARGLQVDLKKETLRLQSAVRGRFERGSR